MAIPSDPPQPDFGWPRKWWSWLMDLLLWMKSKQPIPSKNDFSVSERANGTYFRLNYATVATAVAALSAHRLQLLIATDGATVQYRVRLGKVAGVVADAGMTDPGDDPPFLKVMSSPADGVYVIYCKLAMTYSGNGEWAPEPGDIFTGTVGNPLPDNDDDWFYVEIGQLRCEGGEIVEILPAQAAKNDVAIGRRGNDTDYVDVAVQVLAS